MYNGNSAFGGKKYIYLAVGLAVIAVSFGAGFIFGAIEKLPHPVQGIINQEFAKPKEFDFGLFWQAWNDLHEKYVDKEKLSDANLLYGAISGMVKGAGDPYTVYFPPTESKSFKQDVGGSFGGIGAEIGKRNGFLAIIAPLEGTPAKKAGLLAGDKILKINGESTEDLSVEQAVVKIRGEVGTKVVLTILRGNGTSKSTDITIERAIIKIPITKIESLKDNKIAHLSFYSFTSTAPFEFQQSAAKILSTTGYKGIILDLRNNPGGFLEVAVDVAGWFLNTGDLVAVEDFGKNDDNRKTTEFRASGLGALKNYPMVILVNQGTASAAEILAGALRDNRGVKLVGEKTFGKGSVQELVSFNDSSSLKVTVAKWLTPKKYSISESGLEPDYKVSITEDDINKGKDPQLDKAAEILEKMINQQQ
ncbi:S41 family peptidase [Candidatus Wolfebacteria bacterium]|nr:S41 family peptidase [Candidatus Wolfebacteria bacterium]